MVVDAVARTASLSCRKRFLRSYAWGKGLWNNRDLFLVKPLTYMNRSGEVLPAILKKYDIPLDQVLVVCDNLDLPPGACRLKRSGSAGTHNGIRSITRALESGAFMRLYLGIGRPERKSEVTDYVLGEIGPTERALYTEAVQRGASAVLDLLDNPVQHVMNELTQRRS